MQVNSDSKLSSNDQFTFRPVPPPSQDDVHVNNNSSFNDNSSFNNVDNSSFNNYNIASQLQMMNSNILSIMQMQQHMYSELQEIKQEQNNIKSNINTALNKLLQLVNKKVDDSQLEILNMLQDTDRHIDISENKIRKAFKEHFEIAARYQEQIRDEFLEKIKQREVEEQELRGTGDRRSNRNNSNNRYSRNNGGEDIWNILKFFFDVGSSAVTTYNKIKQEDRGITENDIMTVVNTAANHDYMTGNNNDRGRISIGEFMLSNSESVSSNSETMLSKLNNMAQQAGLYGNNGETLADVLYPDSRQRRLRNERNNSAVKIPE